MKMTKATEIPQVSKFLSDAKRDLEQFKIEAEAESRLELAVENYEKVFKRKLTVNWVEQ